MAENEQKIEQVKLGEAGAGVSTQASTEERLHALEVAFANILRKGEDIRGLIHFQSFSSDPTKCSIGDVAVVGGKLKICTAANTWTIVGTQT